MFARFHVRFGHKKPDLPLDDHSLCFLVIFTARSILTVCIVAISASVYAFCYRDKFKQALNWFA